MNLFKFFSAILLATQLIACGGGGGAALGALVGAINSNSPGNEAPIANAGITQNVSLGFVDGVASKLVTLDGTGSTDPNNNPLTFAWTLTKPAGSAAVLSSASAPKPTFTADVVGTYTATLLVKDDANLESKASSVVTIVASISNSAPVANAGAKQFVVFGSSSTVTLDGTYSTDADNDQLTYKWTLLQKPSSSTAVLSSTTAARPTFKADLVGDYVAQLSLDGTNSSDANFDTLTYQWDWMSSPGSAPTLSSATSPKPTFTPTTAGTYVLTLTVSDGKLKSTPDPITINVVTVSGGF